MSFPLSVIRLALQTSSYPYFVDDQPQWFPVVTERVSLGPDTAQPIPVLDGCDVMKPGQLGRTRERVAYQR